MSINNRPKLNRLIDTLTGLPLVHGDYYRPADRVIDVLHSEGFTGDAISQLLTTPSILSGLIVTINTDTTRLDITSGIAVGFDSQILSLQEHNYDGNVLSGTDPITSNSYPINVGDGLTAIPRFINLPSSLTAVSTASVPNSGTGYVKIRFKDAGQFTRNTPTDPSGTRYPFITRDSYEIIIDNIAAVSTTDVLLATFTKNVSGNITLSSGTGTRDVETGIILNNGYLDLPGGNRVKLSSTQLTANRTYTLQDKDMTIAGVDDITKLYVKAGASISLNNIVCVTGDDAAGGKPIVSPITTPVQVPIGIATSAIANNADGTILNYGRYTTALDTTLSVIGAPVYIDTAGALTLAGNRYQVGIVESLSATGVVFFDFSKYNPDVILVTAGIADVTAGTVVTVTGEDTTNGRFTVQTVSTTLQPPLGYAVSAITAGAAGQVIKYGRITTTLDTTGLLVGAPVYCNLAGALVLTGTRFKVGNVVTVGTNAVVFLSFNQSDAMLPGGNIYLPTGRTITLAPNLLTADRTYTLPDKTMTLAGLDDVGMGGGADPNYITFPIATSDPLTNGWRTYADAAGFAPVDGTGGTANSTLTRNITDPISNTGDFLFTKTSGTTRRGEGFSYDITIDRRHITRVLQISFDYKIASGTYTQPIAQVSATYSVSSLVCTVTSNGHGLVVGQAVNINFTSGTTPANGLYVIATVPNSNTFAFSVSAGSSGNCTYSVPSDLRVYMIQDPDGTPAVIEPTNVEVPGAVIGTTVKHIATFQTNAGETTALRKYRFCVHQASSGTLGYTAVFNNFNIYEQKYSIGSIITDWQSYTPGTAIAGANSSFKYKRSGSDIIIHCNIYWTGSGSMVFTPAQILPPGLSIDVSKLNSITSNNRNVIAFGYHTDASVQNSTANFIYDTAANSFFTLPTLTAPGIGDSTGIEFFIPISGWGSSVAMSSDSGDGRVVACLYRNNSSGGTSSTDPLKYTDLQFDTHNAYNTSTGRYTAPVSGYYSVKFSTASGNQGEIILRKQGSNYLNMGLTNGSGGTVTPRAYGSTLVYLNAGEFIDLVPSGNLSITTSTIYFFSVERVSAGSQIIATQETVAFRVTKTSNDSGGTTDVDVVCGSNSVLGSFDTHGAYNLTTGIITAPVSGIYILSGIMYVQSVTSFSVGDSALFYITNTSNNIISQFGVTRTPTNNAMVCVCNSTLRLLSGQQIKIRFTRSANSSQSTLQGSPTIPASASFLAMTKIGI